MSSYPNRPGSAGGWPEQPPPYSQGGGYRYQPGDQWLGDEPRYGGRRRRRRRGWIALLVTLIVLAVIFVVGDRVARSYAQDAIASKIHSDGFPVKPTVSIPGFPFLTQVLARDIRTINLSASNVPEGKLTISSINATASGVHINSSFNGGTISHISGTGLVTFSSVASAAPVGGLTITADPSAGPGAAKVSLGPLSAVAQVTRSGPSQLSVQLKDVPGIASSLEGGLSSFTIDVPHLPAGLQVTGVSVTNQGVLIDFAAQNTSLSQ